MWKRRVKSRKRQNWKVSKTQIREPLVCLPPSFDFILFHGSYFYVSILEFPYLFFRLNYSIDYFQHVFSFQLLYCLSSFACSLVLLLLLLLLSCFNHVRLFATPWTVSYQAPLLMGFSSQKYWSGVPLPSPLSVSTFCNNSNLQFSSVTQLCMTLCNPMD